MFHQCHNLHRVVASPGYAGQYVLAELIVGTHSLLVLRNPNMRFIDQRNGIRREVTVSPLIWFERRPDLCIEDLGRIILNNAARICRDAVALPALPVYAQPVQVFVVQGV